MANYIKQSKDYNPHLNELIMKYNFQPQIINPSKSNYGSSSSSSSNNCNSGGKGWSYSPYTQGNSNPSYLYNGH